MENKLTDEQIIERIKGLKVGDSLIGLKEGRPLTEKKLYPLSIYHGYSKGLCIEYDCGTSILIDYKCGSILDDLKNGFLGFYEEPKETQLFKLDKTIENKELDFVTTRIRTDKKGLEILREIQADVIKREQIAEYENEIESHKDDISLIEEKIQKLKEEINNE